MQEGRGDQAKQVITQVDRPIQQANNHHIAKLDPSFNALTANVKVEIAKQMKIKPLNSKY